MSKEPHETRGTAFEALVLQALWVLILCAWGQRGLASRAATNFQSGALGYLDEHGNQREGSAKYRREVSFPNLTS